MASSSYPLPPPLSSFKTHRNHHVITSQRPSTSALLPLPIKLKGPIELSNPSTVPKWRRKVSFLSSFLKNKEKSKKEIKEELFEAIAPLDRGAEAAPEDQERIEQIACKLEALNSVKEPLKSDLINGKWELLYTTSTSILQNQVTYKYYNMQRFPLEGMCYLKCILPSYYLHLNRENADLRPKLLRPNGKIYQAINADTLRAQNMETWPFFNQAVADLIPLNSKRVAVKFNAFKIAGLIPIKAPERPVEALGQLEITYLDEEIRVSRGNRGNLFILKMVDPSYRAPV